MVPDAVIYNSPASRRSGPKGTREFLDDLSTEQTRGVAKQAEDLAAAMPVSNPFRRPLLILLDSMQEHASHHKGRPIYVERVREKNRFSLAQTPVAR
jgi:hypothetical protein